jgi:hypothetical protein
VRVFENGVLREIFRPTGDEVPGEWRRLHNEELYGLYSSPSVIGTIKSRGMKWACSTCGGEERCTQGFCGEA